MGRQIARLIFENLMTNEDLGMVYNMADLMNLKWLGDEKLETFRHLWNVYSEGVMEFEKHNRGHAGANPVRPSG